MTMFNTGQFSAFYVKNTPSVDRLSSVRDAGTNNKLLILADREAKVKRRIMIEALDEFNLESQELRKIRQLRSQEQLLTNRLIKNEVIDMAERIEKIEKLMQN
jgi:hypothetical protein